MKVYISELDSFLEFKYLKEEFKGVKLSELPLNHPFISYLKKTNEELDDDQFNELLDKTIEFEHTSAIGEADVIIGFEPLVYNRIVIINLPITEEEGYMKRNHVISRFVSKNKFASYLAPYDLNLPISVKRSPVKCHATVTPIGLNGIKFSINRDESVELETSDYFFQTKNSGYPNLVGYLENLLK